MKNLKFILRLTLTLLLITAVTAGLLALVNSVTEDKIAAQTAQKVENALRAVLPADSYEAVEGKKDGVSAVYLAAGGGCVVRVSVNGFGGAIDMMVGVGADGAVTGVSIISHAETPSLGANCTREKFRDQYTGKTDAQSVNKDGGEIEALTGATVTSRALTQGVNLALETAKEVLG